MKNLPYWIFLLILFILMNILTVREVYSQSGIYVRPDSTSLPTPVTGQTWLFNSTNGQIYVWNGTAFFQISPPQPNYTGVAPPTTSNDASQGFQVGSVWVDGVTDAYYVCTDPTIGAAVWLFLASPSINPALIPQLLYTGLSTGDFVSANVIPTPPGSGLTMTLPGGNGYVDGSYVTIPTAAPTFTDNMWTYVFINTDGSYNYQVQSPMTTPPVVADTVLAYLVEASGGNVTAVVPYYALPATLRNYMLSVPGTTGLVLQTDTSVPATGLKYALVPVGSLDATGTSAGQTLISSGSAWASGTLPLAGLSSSGSTANQVLGINSAATGYEYKSLTAGPGVTITPTTGVTTIAAAFGTTTTQTTSFAAAPGNLYLCNGTLTVTLPDATTCAGQEIVVWNIGTSTITYAVTSAQTINGSSSTFTRNTQWQVQRFISDGANWEMFEATGPTS